MKRLLVGLAGLVLIAGHASAQELTKLRVAYDGFSMTSAPLYYAAGDIPPTYAAASVLGVMVGTRAGFWIAARASSQWLKVLLGLVLVFVAAMMLVRA